MKIDKDDNVIELKISEKKPEEKSVFQRASRQCYHSHFMVDETLNNVTCGKCKKELNPMWVLKELCQNEAYDRRRLSQLREEVKATENKMRCKCENCGKMTRIAR